MFMLIGFIFGYFFIGLFAAALCLPEIEWTPDMMDYLLGCVFWLLWPIFLFIYVGSLPVKLSIKFKK